MDNEGNLHGAKHEQPNHAQLLAGPQLQLPHLYGGEHQDGDVDDQMGQCRAKEELGVVNVAARVLDRRVPKGLRGDAVENSHKGADDDPDDGHDAEDLDGQADGRPAEDAPVQAEDGNLGAEEGEGVE